MSTATHSAQVRPRRLATALPWLVAAALYLVVLAAGNSLLNDADTYWHIAVGDWILAHGFPHSDPFSFTFTAKPWIAKEWLSQLILDGAYRAGGWTAVVVLTAGALALAFALLARFLQQRLMPIAVIASVAVAFMLVAPHATARPHVLALPVMVAWVAGLVRAADTGKAPSPWLLLLMVLWANLHGGFTLGIFLVGAFGLDAIVSARPAERTRTAIDWIGFGLMALVAGCVTPYGPASMFVTVKVLGLGPALSLIGEWKPADFSRLGPLELALLLGTGLAFWRGLRLPPVRILILAGLVHMALSAARNGEVLGLLAPLVLMAPLARQFPETRNDNPAPARPAVVAIIALLLVPATAALANLAAYQPNPRVSPVAAVAALKAANTGPVLNDYDFGGYLVFAGMAPFIDGRTELYGGDFTRRAYDALTLADLAGFKSTLDEYRIGATLLAPKLPAVALLDTMPGWKRLYADDVAVVHIRLPLRSTLP